VSKNSLDKFLDTYSPLLSGHQFVGGRMCWNGSLEPCRA